MKYYTLLIIALLGAWNSLHAQTRSSEAGLKTDNDSYLFSGSDRYYTNGIFFYYRHALPVKAGDSTRLQNKILGFEAGQKMYNPQGADIPNQDYIDRPFAGYLYVGSTLNLLYKDESSLKLSTQLGVTGQYALGKETQDLIHHVFGFYSPTGWRYQIRNDFELNLSAEYNRLLWRTKGVDLSVNAYGNLGNGFTGAGAGPVLRTGLFNQLFNSVITQSTAIHSNATTPLQKFELFAYYKPLFNYIGYDATIQGSLYRHHPVGINEITYEPVHYIFSQQIGVAYAGNRWVFDAAVVLHQKEVAIMFQNHQWGTITALYRFR